MMFRLETRASIICLKDGEGTEEMVRKSFKKRVSDFQKSRGQTTGVLPDS